MKREAKPPQAMGKKGRLAMAIIWTVGTLLAGMQLWRALSLGTASNAPGWPAYALWTALSGLNTVCWMVSWLRAAKTQPRRPEQDRGMD